MTANSNLTAEDEFFLPGSWSREARKVTGEIYAARSRAKRQGKKVAITFPLVIRRWLLASGDDATPSPLTDANLTAIRELVYKFAAERMIYMKDFEVVKTEKQMYKSRPCQAWYLLVSSQ